MVWCELLPYAELRSRGVLSLLAARSVGVYVAVTPDIADGLPNVVKACRDAGVLVGVWPMLGHGDGRWPNADNVAVFEAFVWRVLDALERHGALPDELAIDLEPGIADLVRLLAFEPRAIAARLVRGPKRRAARAYRRLVERIEARGIATLAAAIPLVLADAASAEGGTGWQRFLGTPVDALPCARVSPMIYTSMLEGYAGGALGRADVTALLAAGARAAVRRHGARASLSLGAVGHGILGDERTYRDTGELATDVAIARAAGVEHLVAFSLCGMLGRPPAEAWLDALVHAEPSAAPPPRTRRAAAVLVAAGAAARGMELGATAARGLLPSRRA